MIKILHTSDWHLGQSFYSKSRKEEHQAFLAWLLKQVEEKAIDAVIVAGDIFDTSAPPSYAREMYNQFVVDLQSYRCSLILLGGNHDSVAVLNESKPLIERLNSYVVASTAMPLSEQLITLTNSAGEVSALVCAIPFIRVRDVMLSQAGESIGQKNANLDHAIRNHYQQLYQLALDFKHQHQLAVPIIMTGHLAAMGVSLSESVRDIYVGNLSGFSAEGFPPADYIALGHIHRPQTVSKQEHIRYCGSPIPLSFDELSTNKQVLIAEFKHDKLTSIGAVEIPRFQPMAVLSGNLQSIAEQLQNLPMDKNALPIWLQLKVNESDFLSDLHHRVAEITADLPVEVLKLEREFSSRSNTLSQAKNETLEELSPQDVFAKRLSSAAKAEQEADRKLEQRLTTLHQAVLEDLQQNEQGE